jgi:phenol/toluene 2-monooxygenase (NADH) P0/A0
MAGISRIDAHRPASSSRCHVRVTNPDRRGFVEFQFSMGDPSLYLEMTLPPAAFIEFCARHGASRLSAAQARAVDRYEQRWTGEDVRDVD